MNTKCLSCISLTIFSFLLSIGVVHATPTLTLEIQGGFYDPVTETWTTHDSSFTLRLIASGGSRSESNDSCCTDSSGSHDGSSDDSKRKYGKSDDKESSDRNSSGGSHDSDSSSGSDGNNRTDKLFGVNLVIAVPGSETEIETGTVSLDGGATTIPSSAFSFGTPQFDTHALGPSQYPSHDIYPTWFALDEVNSGDEFNLPRTFTYDVVATGFSWVHLDAFGYYETACGRNVKIQTVFVPPSHDAEYVAEAMAVPEPSTFSLMLIGLSGFVLSRISIFKRKLQVEKLFSANNKS